MCTCYESGRDGFWLHRALMKAGIQNVVVDASSIEVNRRQKQVKSDPVDAGKLVNMLCRYHVCIRMRIEVGSCISVSQLTAACIPMT